jgi:SAM-dependent methyltransferase
MKSRLRKLLESPRRVLSLLVNGSERLQQGAVDARRAASTSQKNARALSGIDRRTTKMQASIEELARASRATASELDALREEMRDRLLQYNLQLGRLAKQAAPAGDDEDEVRLSQRAIPLAVEQPGTTQRWGTVGETPHPDPDGREWLTLDSCPMCRSTERTVVSEWNKFLLMDKAPDQDSARYDYSICHTCGVCYAVRRPFGRRYTFMLENFGEVTNKHDGAREFTNPLLNPYALTEADREELRRRARPGFLVSEHLGLDSGAYLDGLTKDRFENSVHVDILSLLAPPKGGRVLEIRPRTGMISESLRRLFGAEVCTLPIWESQQFLLREVYGIEAAGLVDYDRFEVPYTGLFDLVICNHMLTHAVRPQAFFAAIARALKPGGHIYFYNEPDDAQFLRGNQSIFACLNALHLQSFDRASFVRGLAANGFEVVFHRSRHGDHMSLARFTPTTFTPMTAAERDARISAYRTARDRAVLGLRGAVRDRFAEEWPQLLERGVAAGLVEFDHDGTLRLVSR